MVRVLAPATVIALAACGSIDHTQVSQQRLNKELVAGRNDLVLRIDRQRDLENVLGKADIFGRKTHEGFTELRFAGVDANGEVVFYRKDVQIMTNETAMSRNPFVTTTGTASTSLSGSSDSYGGSTQYRGTATTNFNSTTVVPTSDYHVVVPSGTTAIRLKPSEKKLPVSGYIIEIVSASGNALTYVVTGN